MRLLVDLAVLGLLSPFSLGAIIVVPDDYPTIQGAIDAANYFNDTIVVRPGRYVENINFHGKKLTLVSETGPRNTIIDGGNPTDPEYWSVVTMTTYESRDSIIDGFTITNGIGKKSPYNFVGGGIYCGQNTQPLIRNNIITGNSSPGPNLCDFGGGIYSDGDPLVLNNVISNNFALLGGGVYCSVFCAARTIIYGNIVCENHALGGGGIYVDDLLKEIEVKLANNTIYGNEAWWGGGIYIYDTRTTVTNNTIVANKALTGKGGGIYSFAHTLNVANTILWGNAPDQIDAGPLFVNYCDIEGGHAGIGNIDEEPLFVSASSNDYHLTYHSPCRNAGDNTAAALPPRDFEGDPRISEDTVDMGADEFHPHLYVTGKVAAGETVDIVFVNQPQTSPVVLLISQTILSQPVGTPYGGLWVAPPFSQVKRFQPIPADGVRVCPHLIGTNLPPGRNVGMQAVMGNALSNLFVAETE